MLHLAARKIELPFPCIIVAARRPADQHLTAIG
jgi:hypothetical protein